MLINFEPADNFIRSIDNNHHTTIEGLASTFASSGEMVIVDRSYKVISRFKVN